MKKRKKKLSCGDILISAVVLLISMVCVLPFLYVLSISFTDPDAYEPFKFYILPPKWSLESYKYILSTHSYINSLKSTLFITIVGTVLDLAVTLSMAYGLTKTDLPGHKLIYGMVVVTLFFSAGTIP
ncbi:MAG: carbohydrate ABC transporter permease, partial [Clostridiaceae bacterium]|nr:carbohydrate ABC transporter permease [Clostridiaceae bacterium]